MVCLTYENEHERAKALVAIARRCRTAQTAFAFVGSTAECGAVRPRVTRLAAAVNRRVIYRETNLAVTTRSHAALSEFIGALRTTLLDLSADGRPFVVWIESPLMPDGASHQGAMWVYRNAVEDFAVLARLHVINAYRIADIAPAVRANLFEVANAVISARAISPLCPPWLIEPPPETRRADGRGDGATTPCVGFAFGSLLQAEKLATIGRMAAGFAHELGNPLSMIRLSIQQLQQRFDAAADPAGKFATIALKSVERMQSLLQNIREAACVRERHFEAVELKEIVLEVLHFAAAEFHCRGIAVQTRFDSSLPRVFVDPRGVKQVVLNVVRNALEAMADGGGALRVHAVWSRDKNTAVLKIANSGPAIAPADLQRIFQPFYTTKKDGTGLGLFLSRKIAREHGGDLAAENVRGGVRFVLTLPRDPHERDGHVENIDCG